MTIPVHKKMSKTCYDQAKGLESYCGFLPIRKGTKAPLVPYKNEPHLPLAQALKFNPAYLISEHKLIMYINCFHVK